MSSDTVVIGNKIVELLTAATFSVPIVAVLDLEPSYDVTWLDGRVRVIVTPKERVRTLVARGLVMIEHKVTVAIMAALKPKSNYSLQDLEGLQEEIEDWADECDFDRPEALTDNDVLAIYSPTRSKQDNTFLSGTQLTFVGGHTV